MDYKKIWTLPVALAGLMVSVGACSSTVSTVHLEEPKPTPYRTHLSEALAEFGFLLQAYPSRRPFRLDQLIIVEIAPISNFSGEDGLPPDFSTVLTTVVSQIGFPIAPKPPISYREREVAYGNLQVAGPAPDLTLRGSVTEVEKRLTTEYNYEMDILFEDRGSDGRPGRDSVDFGGSKGGGHEVRTLALDLHLVDASGLVVEATSHRIDVVRQGTSSNFGVFFRGSGLGYRHRNLIANSNSQALRIAAQQAVLVLFGRYFRVPYWRTLPDAEPDMKLIDTYRATLQSGRAPEDFRLLLFAHGVEIAFNSYTFSSAELDAIGALKGQWSLPAETSNLELAIHLWQTVPYRGRNSRLASLRTSLQADDHAIASSRSALGDNSMLSLISQLRPGQQLFVPIFFDYDLSMLSEPAKQRIDRMIEALRTSGRFHGDWWIELRGHSDERGHPTKLQELSSKRAERVRQYLEDRHQVPSERIASAGFGSTMPALEQARTEEEHSQNRRVELLLVAGKRPETDADAEAEADADATSSPSR